jgi:hypothetical protein
MRIEKMQGEKLNINFKDYFQKKIVDFKQLEKDGLLITDNNTILETKLGKSLKI